jgi:hypothetical protein
MISAARLPQILGFGAKRERVVVMDGSGPRQTAKRTRVSRPKTKSGCRTCKLRHVKCDELRPVCRRCLSTGRHCDGYGIWGGGGNSYGSKEKLESRQSKQLETCSISEVSSSTSQQEKGAFDFFKHRSSVKLPGVFDSGFWETLVLQSSYSEPAVLHALMSLGAIHRSMANFESCKKRDFMNPDERLALQQYNKAIGHLDVHFKSQEKTSLRVALITCMIFICIELLRGRFKVATTHLTNGLNLLRVMQQRGKPIATENSILLRPEPGSVDDYLIEAFTRLNIHSGLFGQGASFLYIVGQDTTCGPEYEVPPVFETARIARLYLDGLMNGTYFLSVQIEQAFATQNHVPDALVDRQQRLQSSLDKWLQTFDACFPSLMSNANRRAIFGLPLLRLFYSMASIMIATCVFPGDEMIYDSYTPEFIYILTEAVQLWKRVLPEIEKEPRLPNSETPVPSFTVDMGFIPPLYYTAIKCRVPSIRRKAVNLLLAAPHREGVWDGIMVAEIARHIMRIEEGKSYKESPVAKMPDVLDLGSIVVDNVPLVPESARVYDSQVILPDGVGSSATLVCKYGPRLKDVGSTKTVEFDLVFDEMPTTCAVDCDTQDGECISRSMASQSS